MIIGIDVDGVLASFDATFIPLLRTFTDVPIPDPGPDFPDCWDWPDVLEVPKEAQAKAWHYVKTTSFMRGQQPLPRAYDALGELKRLAHWGNDVYFITSRPGKWAKTNTELWLQDHGFRLPTVLVSYNKGPLAASLKLDLFIDDKPENCREVARATGAIKGHPGTCTVCMVDQPWNRNVDPSQVDLAYYGIRRVPNAYAAVEQAWEEQNGFKAA